MCAYLAFWNLNPRALFIGLFINIRPKSPIGKAITYLIERKEELGRFLKDGKVELSNIQIENAIRPLAIGRKNYLYADVRG